MLIQLESDHLFTFNFALLFHQYSTTIIFRPLKNMTKHLFILYHLVIPFSFTFKSPALHKFASASSISKSYKFLFLQFLVKYCKLHSVFKILTKSHMLGFLNFILSKGLNSPNLYISWVKILNLCMLNCFKDFHLCFKWAHFQLFQGFSFMYQMSFYEVPW